MNKGNSNRIKKGLILFPAIFFALALPTAAWKSRTHVHLAMAAMADAVDDGKVTINLVNFKTGEVEGILGEYLVDPLVLSALRSFPAQYRAGAIGPDAYPDLITGQQGIHPDNSGRSASGGVTSDAWLQHIWHPGLHPPEPGDNPLAIKAFTTGFFTHAAGDLFGHAFVNNYSGGVFDVVLNAIRHIYLESYIDIRTPTTLYVGSEDDFFDISIDYVKGFIYKYLLTGPLMGETGPDDIETDPDWLFIYSPPRLFAHLRGWVDGRVKALENNTLKYLQYRYYKYWRDDIDDGLKAWIDVWHKFAETIALNKYGSDWTLFTIAANSWWMNHLPSMLGAPDLIANQFGATAAEIEAITNFIRDELPTDYIDMCDAIRLEGSDYFLDKIFGVKMDELKSWILVPQTKFNLIMGDEPGNPGERITIREFNKNVLQIADTGYFDLDEKYDWEQIPAMYNSVTMMKLLMISQAGIIQMAEDLKTREIADDTAAARIKTASNKPLILGFIKSLDGDPFLPLEKDPEPWSVKDMVLAGADPCIYKKIFMEQRGQPRNLHIPDDFESQRASIEACDVDLCYEIDVEEDSADPSLLIEECYLFYPLDGDAEAYGEGPAGQMHGTTATENRFDEADRALYFDGSSYIDVGGLGSLQSYSVAFWVNPEVYEDHRNVFSLGGLTSRSDRFRAEFHDNWFDQKFTAFFGKGHGPKLYKTVGIKDTDHIPVGRWSFVVMTHEQTNNENRLYIDGRLIGSVTQEVVLPNPRLNIGVGYAKAPQRYFKGKIDDFYLFDRVITPLEIMVLFKGSGKNPVKPAE